MVTLIPFRVGPERPRQLEKGAFYRIRGHNRAGHTIPDQLIQIAGTVRYTRFLGQPVIPARVWTSLEGIPGVSYYYTDSFPLTLLNITHQGAPGYHDRHLERVELAQLTPQALTRALKKR